MSYTDQKPRVATEKECKASWGGSPNGERFRCYLCGYRFTPGDIFRWVMATKILLCNVLVCEVCDGHDVLDKWKKMHEEAKEKFWWFTEDN